MSLVFENIKENKKDLFSNEELNDIINVLYNISLSEFDNEIKSYKEKLLYLIKTKKEYTLQYKNIKNDYENKIKSLSKEKQINKILNILNKLIIDGKITPKLSNKIITLLNTIYEKDFEHLKDLEEKLYAYTN